MLSFLLTISYAKHSLELRGLSERRDRLVALVLSRESRIASIESELSSLRARVDALDRNASGPLGVLEREIGALSILSGTSPVSGPGVSVELFDSPQAQSTNSPDFLIQDVDVQLVVNELWAAGAEAIGVNGERVVSTTAIRSAGKSILVNYQVLRSPYRLDAIGNSSVLEAGIERSEIAQRFRRWNQIYQLKMTVQSRSNLTLPAFVQSSRRGYSPGPS
ncbi:MAG: DUF881 domain-containing protein [Actinomycetota bacterium]